mmetsp:Transcript_4220/g.6246  ORF Transcript_4220/g.6246 Transcript_4220/m.6246 type:complete len:216 (-) Transcript_4220:363-1010(-)
MKWRMYMMGSIPNSIADLPSISVLFFNRSGGKCPFSVDSAAAAAVSEEEDDFDFDVPTISIISWRASISFIFINGQVAHPPAVLHPSPPPTPGTIDRLLLLFPSVSSTPMTASDATGKMISTSTCAPGCCPRISCTEVTIDVTMPASVPRINWRRSPPPFFLLSSFATASLTFLEINCNISDVDPVVPLPCKDFSMAIWNISPGTSRWAVTKASW